MEEFKEDIQKVLNGELQHVKSSILLSPKDVHEYLESIGLEQGDFDSNGWDWDFWMSYTKGDEEFTFSGSGWDNTGLTFSKDE